MVGQNEETLVLREATGARQNTERLLPLLDLLNETSDETSPIDELKGLLAGIVEILGHHTMVLSRLESACATAPPHTAQVKSTFKT
jgi:hypothetical protein